MARLRRACTAPASTSIRAAHGRALSALQYTYRDETGKLRGGVVVSDPVNKYSSSRLFEAPC
jgi:hypothetical protein